MRTRRRNYQVESEDTPQVARVINKRKRKRDKVASQISENKEG